MATKFPKFSQALAQDPATRRIWYGIATAHDLEAHDSMTEETLYQKIFASHFGHLAVIFLWTSGNLFHVAWQGNFEQWQQNPLKIKPIAHAIWDPHFGEPALKAFTKGGLSYPGNIAYSGVYHWWYTIGMRTNQQLYVGSIFLLGLSALLLYAGWLHLQPKFRPSLSWFKNNESRLNHHLSGLFGFLALVYILVKTPLYTSTITMYPAGDLSSSKAVMGTNLATLAESFGLAGMSAAPNYNIPDIVTSTRIKKEIVIQGWATQFLNLPTNLISYWEIDQDNFNPIQWVRSLFPSGKLSTTQENKFLDKAILELEDRISVSESGSGLLTISVDMEEPQLAADIANYISQFVIDFVSKVQRTNAFKNRVFIEEQLNNASVILKNSERILVTFKNSHPEKMDTAELKMKRMGLMRDIEENQTVYLTLRQQFEIARIDEQKEEILINILDEAHPAVKISKPKRLMTLLIAGFLGFALAIPVILYRDYPAI